MKEIWIGVGVVVLAFVVIFCSLLGYSKYKASQKAWTESQSAWAKYNAKYGGHPEAAKTPQELTEPPKARGGVVGMLNTITAAANATTERLNNQTAALNDRCVIATLRSINTAQTIFHANKKRYAKSYGELSEFTPNDWSNGELKCNAFIQISGGGSCYEVQATPAGSGEMYFTDCSGVIRAGGSAKAPPIP
jgi:hypothetical protein